MAYCLDLWRQTPFSLKLTKPRHTKAGDFSVRQNRYRISINHNLNPYQFLVTYVHEVAHLHTARNNVRISKPHGGAWKTTFQNLLSPLLKQDIFPEPLLTLLICHMRRPKASTFSDPMLTRAFRMFDPTSTDQVALRKLKDGSLFCIRGRYFKKGKLLRTRFLCYEVTTSRAFLVPADALVTESQLVLF